MPKRALPIALILLAVVPTSLSPATFPEPPLKGKPIERVILISIDAVNWDYIFDNGQNPQFSVTPNLGELIRHGTAFKRARGVLPAVTQVNHLVMVTGCYPERIGVPANEFFDLERRKLIAAWKNPELIKVKNLFQVLEENNSSFTTAVVAGKNYVGVPIWADLQVAPAKIPDSTKRFFPDFKEFPEPILNDATDSWVMDKALKILDKADPQVMLIHLPYMDHAQHHWGWKSPEAWAQLRWADHQIGRLLKYLKQSGKLERTLIVVTSDHGQHNFWQEVDVLGELERHGIRAKLNPPVNYFHLYLENAEQVEEAVRVIRSMGIANGIWYENEIDEIHLRTPYTGEIFVSLKPPYKAMIKIFWFKTSSPQIGEHGGLTETEVFMILFGPHVRRGVLYENGASLVDIVPTICDLVGLPTPENMQGRSLKALIYSENSLAPDIEYHLLKETRMRIGLMPILTFILTMILLYSCVSLDPRKWYKVISRQERGAAVLKTRQPLLYLLLITSSISTGFFVYIENLYSDAPGINPDKFLVTMPFFSKLHLRSIWLPLPTSWISAIPILTLVMWLGHMYVGGLILGAVQRFILRTQLTEDLKLVPIFFVPFIASEVLCSLIFLLLPIGPNLCYEFFTGMFWVGFAFSFLFALSLLIEKHQVHWKKLLPGLLVFFSLTALCWLCVLGTFLNVNRSTFSIQSWYFV